MAPEQVEAESIDGRTDLFSLGGVMYTMATGRPPFRAELTMAVLRRICEDTPRPIREINADLPDWFEAIVEKLLAKPVDERFQSASEVSDLLASCLAHLQQPHAIALPESVRQLSRKKRSRPGLARSFAALAGLFCLAVVGWFVFFPPQDDRQSTEVAMPAEFDAGIDSTPAQPAVTVLPEPTAPVVVETEWSDLLDGEVRAIHEQLDQWEGSEPSSPPIKSISVDDSLGEIDLLLQQLEQQPQLQQPQLQQPEQQPGKTEYFGRPTSK